MHKSLKVDPASADQEVEEESPGDCLSASAEFSPSPVKQPYDVHFWLAYAANASLVTANALLTRYVKFVQHHEPEHHELALGVIIGVGMFGGLCMRFSLGSWMDRHGVRIIWL
ncbi:MAG: hypothetical protein N2C14_20135, partial [Planctomycetales bacterium]